MSNKKIYRGLNKRRRFDFRKYITIFICLVLIFGYTYNKFKSKDNTEKITIASRIDLICDKLFFWKNLDISNPLSKLIKKDDVDNDRKTLSNKQSSDSKIENDNKNKSNSNNVEVAIVEGFDVYLIQVGSFDNQSEATAVQNKLNKNNIPNSVVEIEDFKKVQAYISFDEESLRNKLSSVKKIISDSFLTKLEIPTLSLEYTNDYSYVKNISDNLNDLLESYREEATYYAKNKENFNYNDYKKLLNDRKTILDNLNKDLKKIDYSELNTFKRSLLSYTSQVNDRIDISIQCIDEQNINRFESSLISSIQEYYEFINILKKA